MSSSSDVHTREMADERRERRSEEPCMKGCLLGASQRGLRLSSGKMEGYYQLRLVCLSLRTGFIFPKTTSLKTKYKDFLRRKLWQYLKERV